MKEGSRLLRQFVLLGGDMVMLALVTVAGFARHGELATGGVRLLTTFIPLVVAWLLSAPFLGAFSLQRAADLRQLWRPFWAMLLAGPMAAWLRGVWLSEPIEPIFVAVLSGVSILALLAWRGLFWVAISRKKTGDG